MSLKINDNPEYNIAGLMRTDYPELWARVLRCEEELRHLQRFAIEAFPLSKKHVADSVECLQCYLQEKSTYLFAQNVWQKLYGLCNKLTDFPDNSPDARDLEEQLNTYLGKLDVIDFKGLLPGCDADLTAFYEVISSVTYDVVGVVSAWSLRDILGSGYDYPGLLEDTKCDIVPEDLSVGRIESDDTMKRIY